MVEMGVKRISFVKAERNLHDFAAILTSAACEWFLIFLLLIDAVISYLAREFARYCDLQPPCLLCSKLDHVFGNEKPGFCESVLCRSHRSQISSLISCHVHDKLADGNTMCEDCLLSFASKSNSNIVLGKLRLEGCGSQNSSLNRDFARVPITMPPCSCCNESIRSKANVHKLFQLPAPSANIVPKPNIPLPRRLSRRSSLKKVRDKITGAATTPCKVTKGGLDSITTTPRQVMKGGFDSMSHVGYYQLNITSESDSEFLFSDDDDFVNVVPYANSSSVQNPSEVQCKELPDHVAMEKFPHPNLPRLSFSHGTSSIDQCLKPDDNKPKNNQSSEVTAEHASAELNLQQADEKSCPSALPELISLDDIPSPSNLGETPTQPDTVLAELIPQVNTPTQPDTAKVSNEESGISGKADAENVKVSGHEEILHSLSPAAISIKKINQVVSHSDSANPTHEDLHQIDDSSEVNAEQSTPKKSNGNGEDSSLFLTPSTSSHDIQSLAYNTSGNEKDHADSLLMTNSASLESLDGSFASDMEGESMVDHLKRQVKYDQKCLNDLHKELEAERNASAIAADEAMAMITRLQEEKAALHMDALQYLRMMEEQAEYDVDALEKANDLLAEKEKELQDLEAELEYYKLKYPDDSIMDSIPQISLNLAENLAVDSATLSRVNTSTVKLPLGTEGNDKPEATALWSELEDEKLYISQHLKDIERKLQKYTHEEESPGNSDSEESEAVANGGQNQGEFSGNGNGQKTLHVGENASLLLKCSSNGIHPASEKSRGLSQDHSFSKKNSHMVDNGKENSSQCEESELVAIENEISDLNDRLEALESDFNFLEHSFNSLQSGNKGLQYLQEIAHLLKELRRTVSRSTCQSVP